MIDVVLLYKYSSKDFMDIDKIIEFQKNLEELTDKVNIKMCFYGKNTIEEMSTFMSYFNLLVGKKVCDISFSLLCNELVTEIGVNNKSIKKSATLTNKISSHEIINTIKDYYTPGMKDVKIIEMPNKDWQSTILDFKGV